MFRVGVAYEMGRGVEVNLDKAIEYYQKAANLNHSGAMYALGLIYEQNYHDDLKAIKYYLDAAKLGDGHASYRLALYLDDGEVLVQDHYKAYEYLITAVKSEYAPAQNMLGYYLEHGLGCQTDLSQAFKMYLAAASYQDYAPGIYNVGRCYYYGIGTAVDKKAAYEMFTKAASLKDPEANFILGYMFSHGEGTVKNLDKARYYYLEALNLGIEAAKDELDKLNQDRKDDE